MKNPSFPSAAQLGRCALLAGLAGLSLPASAMDWTRSEPGFSIGAGAGADSLNGQDYTGNGNQVDSSQVSYKGLIDFRMNSFVSLESQYVDFGTAEDGNNSVKAHGITAGGVFEAPLTRFAHPYGKAGALFWNADGDFSGVRRTDKGNDFAYGAGLRFLLGRAFDIRTEYERFEFGDNKVNTVSAILQLNF